MSDKEFDDLNKWLQQTLDRVKPGERKKLAMQIGRQLRRSNAARIARNVEPDGSKMAARKPRYDKQGNRVANKAKMFRKIRLAKNLKIDASPNRVEVHFVNPVVDRAARVHHYGLVGFVGRTKKGQIVRTRYDSRQLLGIGPDDSDEIMGLALQFLTKDD